MAFLAILAASANLPQSLGLGRKPRFVKVLCLVSSHQNTSLFLVVQVFFCKEKHCLTVFETFVGPSAMQIGDMHFSFLTFQDPAYHGKLFQGAIQRWSPKEIVLSKIIWHLEDHQIISRIEPGS
jgi:hypothetical protein